MMHFCMIFWTDGKPNSTRERNVKLTWPHLKQMVEYLNTKGVAATANLFDYSPSQIIDDCTHIPYPMGTYKRAEKLNNVVNTFSELDNICLMDCDIFIHRTQWEGLAELINNTTYDVGFFFNFAKIGNEDISVLDNIDPNGNHHLAFSRGFVGGFGGFHLTSIKSIKDVGGYDPKFTTWGGEDGDLLDRWNQKFIRTYVKEEHVLPLHLPHLEDRENILYFNREEYVRNNPV